MSEFDLKMAKKEISLGFVFTNFNKSALTLQAVESIYLESKATSVCEFVIVIVDNLSRPNELQILKNGLDQYEKAILIQNQDNLGYFAGLNEGIKYLRDNVIKLDIIIIGNNDLVFPKEFFLRLDLDQINNLNKSVLCPNLISLDGENQNPHVLKRISRFRELVWDLYFSNYYVGCLISFLANKFRRWLSRKDFKKSDTSGDIYQGYGACYILTSKFFANFETLWSPGFLMGEEFYLAMQLEEIGESMYYISNLKVFHHDHASTSELPNIDLWNFARDAHSIYRKFYNPYKLDMRTDQTMSNFLQASEKDE